MVNRVIAVLCILWVIAAWPVSTRAPQGEAVQRVAERLEALREEAAQLASREQTLLNELRKLEIERQIKTEELSGLDAELRTTQEQLSAAKARAEALGQSAAAQLPDLEARLVRLYKMGRVGHWRLLLDVDDLQSMGRAYRMAAALTGIDRDRAGRHEQTRASLDRERRTLEVRARQAAAMQEKAALAQLALDRAVSSREALMTSIVQRRDLTAQLAAELAAAQIRLQAAVTEPGSATVLVPLRPFRGQMPWPAEGIVTARFGRQQVGRTAGIDVSRNGIEISLPEGRTVAAVHEGVVTFAGSFTAYGNLVIVDHGGGAHTLYGHLSSYNVNKGDRVGAGAAVGLSGRNPGGNPALYFELRIDGQPVDPIQWLRKQP